MMYIHIVAILVCGIINLADSVPQPGCPPNPGVCWAVGDPHIRRMDGTTISLSTAGNIVLAKDDAGTVEVKADLDSGAMTTQLMTVYVTFNYRQHKTSIVLNRGSSGAVINGVSHNLDTPYNYRGVSCTAISRGVVISGDDVNIKWLDGAKLFLALGNKYQGAISGVCGAYCLPSGTPSVAIKPMNLTAAAPANLAAAPKVTTTTTTTTTTATTTTTTLAPTDNEKKTQAFNLRMTMDMVWDMVFLDQTSIRYKRLKQKVEFALNQALRNNVPGFVKYVMFGARQAGTRLVKRSTDEKGGGVVDGTILCNVVDGSTHTAENIDHVLDDAAKNESSPLYRLHVTNIATSEDTNAEADQLITALEKSRRHSRTLTCAHQGMEYEAGSSMEMKYGECICVDGEWECNDGPELCGIFGKGEVETFDETLLHINGSCTFKLVADCTDAQDFAIFTSESYKCTADEKKKKRSLRVEFNKGNIINIGPDDISVNGDVVTTDTYADDAIGVRVESETQKYKVTVGNVGVIEWDGELMFDIIINSKYEGDTCGVCGNSNGNKDDDNEWKQHSQDATCHEDAGCAQADIYHVQQIYKKACGDLNNVSFPIYSNNCDGLRTALVGSCDSCEGDIMETCMRESNMGCIHDNQKKCVTNEIKSYLTTCYQLVFGTSPGKVKRDIRAQRVKKAIDDIDVDSMTLDDMNQKLADPELWA